VEALLSELRPEAVGLVEAFDWTDFALKSALGRSDGDVYNALLESAKREPLNAKDPVDGFVQIYRGPQARL
jgi:acyl-CoA oxidase